MISFAVEGGFANQMRTIRIDPAGHAEVELSGESVRGELDTARVAQIVAQLEACGLFDRDRAYPPPRGIDLQRYEIAYGGATIVAYDTTVPPELTEAVRLLEESLRAVQR